MIYLITGTPGAGKTLRGLHWLTKEFTEGGRPIYSNIDGLSLDSLGLPDDWRDTPEGSVLIIDEVQKIWPSSGRPGVSSDPIIRALEEHRHTGHDFILITQHPTLVDSHVRKLVSRHEHLRRAFGGAEASHIYSNSEVMNVGDKKELKNVDSFVWKFDKTLYQLYKSASLHTVKWKLPKVVIKYGLILFFLMLVLFTALYFVFGAGGMFDRTKESVSNASSAAVSSSTKVKSGGNVVTDFIDQFEYPSNYQGCIWTDDFCMCFDEEFNRVQVDLEACQAIVQKPIPIVISSRGRR